MDAHEVNRARAKLALFVADVFASVPRKDQRAKGDCYLRGLMLDGRRKSIQAMAERLPDGNEQNLQQFVNQSTWDPVLVRRRIAERMVPQIGPDAWAVDDVSFPKDGKMSVAVAPQYCGALGKQANCQVAVSVHAVSDTASCPLQWRLFVPQEWADDAVRRRKTGVPEEIGHREKWRLALDTLDELAGWGLVPPVLVADAGYGQNADFRDGLERRSIGYVVAVRSDVTVHPHDAVPTAPPWSGNGRKPQPRYRDKPSSVAALAAGHGRQAFTEVTWRAGSRGPMHSHFLSLRVRPAGTKSRRLAQAAAADPDSWDGVLPEVTLLVEWPAGAEAPTGYWLSNLPADTPLAELVRLAKIRWRIEHDYRELKHGLGLDHFEGRSWMGWHHHVTLVTAAHAFLTEQRLAPKADTADSPSTRSWTSSKTC
ncbi:MULTISPECIES: IS701 family transposase [unclassified Streptomyces]|uniref:IS701 family transposase n=1 Tax=unclassified Streptomyces TaxID=2593676 RepID=UPI00225BB327|nr:MULTISPECIES: IS701 family transposase [unclassified Streptomyces]MCX4645360.1 IS701 family transposase [Streptomyces sp. NBC_01446]MCX4648037.1 IS701 family transposase [Streptomyces sp. NBC_01446]MCX5325872.1 IS701 family transposase [Streptomyces sp. NBC_00120]